MATIKTDAVKKHKISPYLYMQFMEPLGTADSSVDCGWDFIHNKWYDGLIDRVNELAPTMVRWGGCFASYYHWKEAVGRPCDRIPMYNYCWDGIFANRVGTHEVIDFCRCTSSEPLLVVNMESDGRMHWAYPENGENRFGSAEEAAQWVTYCNAADDPLRSSHGHKTPYNVKYWQIGNETSYDRKGYGSDKAAEVTKRFAEAMRRADPTIRLIGWGDYGSGDDTWCRKMSKVDGIDTIAFHHHFDSGLPDSPLCGTRYRDDAEYTWKHLMNAYRSLEDHIAFMRENCGGKKLAMTEGHYALPGRNRCEVLSSWGTGVSYARCLNVVMRNSDIMEIGTMADFFGNVWQVNAILMTTPMSKGIAYLQPVGEVMSLFRHHQGEYAVNIACDDHDIDITASMTGDKVYLHIINTDMKQTKRVKLDIGRRIASAEMYSIASDPTVEITPCNTDVFKPVRSVIEGDELILPPCAVAAVEITAEN